MEKLISKNLLRQIAPFLLILLIGSTFVINVPIAKTNIVNPILLKQIIFVPILKLSQNENGTFRVNTNSSLINKSADSNKLLSEQLDNLGKYLIVEINHK